MHRRAWRWLWIWVGVLVAGCGQLWSSSEGTPSATREPTLPLLGHTLLPATLWPSTATPLITADSTVGNFPPLALYLAITGQTCYQTPVGSLVCLGRVHNPLDVPVQQVTVAVQLFGRDGRPLALSEAMVARAMIPAHTFGPYRVLFDTVPPGYAAAQPVVTSAEPGPPADSRLVELALEEISGAFVMNQYEVTLAVINKLDVPVNQVTVTMILYNAKDEVTGFRQMELPPERELAPNSSLALTMKAIPQGENTIGFEAFAEGYRAE